MDQIPFTVLIPYFGGGGGGRVEPAARLRGRGGNARSLGIVLGLLRRRLLRGSATHPAPGEKLLRQTILGGLFSTLATMSIAQPDPIKIVAAENFYGDVAKQIGGPDVAVTSILNNPDQDPHLFEVSPSVGRDISDARIVIYNGVDLTRGWRSSSGPPVRPIARRSSSPTWSEKRPATTRIFGTSWRRCRPWLKRFPTL